MTIDIKSIKAEAQKEVNEEISAKAKNAYKQQLRVVEAAKQVVRAEELKLSDLEAQIQDGTFR